MKTCTVCQQEKSLEEFYNRKASKDNKAYRCKKCDDKAVKNYRKNRPDSWKIVSRDANIRKRHGIEPEDYQKMFDDQNGVCAICFQEAPITKQHQRLVIDHCHVTNKVRGLLCHKCNQALGLFKDNINNLLNAVEYLKGIIS